MAPSGQAGQRAERGFGLLDYNARYYDPGLGQFVSVDTMVPGPSNPQRLNRYSYVYNNPIRYNDPSGHCPWCLAALGGAIIGGVSSWGIQACANYQAGMSFQEAALNVDVAKIAGAAVGGAIIGGTFGAAGAAGGISALSFWGTVGIGAASNVVAGQASPLAAATVNEAADWLKGQGNLSGADILQQAHEAGFLDPSQIAIDAVSGAVAGGVAHGVSSVLTKVGQSLGLLDQTYAQSDPVWTIKFLPGGEMYLETGRTSLTLPAETSKGYLVILAQEGPERAAKWLFGQVDKQITDYLEETHENSSGGHP